MATKFGLVVDEATRSGGGTSVTPARSSPGRRIASGLLSGRYAPDRRPAPGDVRLDTPWWTYSDDDAMGDLLDRLDQVRTLLTVDGRTRR